MNNTFDHYAEKYDAWYDKHKFAYLSELEAIKRVLPKKGKDLEIGVGTGRFASPLGIKYGIDPSKTMLEIAKKRGKIIIGIIDKDSFLGKFYQSKKSVFYKHVNFFSVVELTNMFKKTGFNNIRYHQTIFNYPDKINSIEKTLSGYGQGGFIRFNLKKDLFHCI